MQYCISLIIRVICTISFLLPLTLAAQPAVTFRDISLGNSLKTTTVHLKQQGFKLVKTQSKEDSLFYGRHKEEFLLGELEGYTTVIHLEASAKTQAVFQMDVIYRECIDEDEAVELASRLAANEKAKSNYYTWELDQIGMGLVEMPDRKGRLTKYVASPVIQVSHRFYNSEDHNRQSYFGCAILTIWNLMMGHEYIVEVHYYDQKAAALAEAEGGGRWAGKLQ